MKFDEGHEDKSLSEKGLEKILSRKLRLICFLHVGGSLLENNLQDDAYLHNLSPEKSHTRNQKPHGSRFPIILN